MQKDDFVIAKLESRQGKPTYPLIRITGKTGNTLTGVIEKDSHIHKLRQTVELKSSEIVLNLGSDPEPGKVYGNDVGSLFRGRKVHDVFGTLFWFYKPKKEISTRLMEAFDKSAATLHKHGLDFVIQPDTCIWEIIPYHGELFAGMYKRSRKPDHRPHVFQIKPEILPYSEYPYVIHHEIGHHLHHQFMTSKKLNAAWIRMYNTSINVSGIKREKSQELLDNLLAQEDSPSNFKSNLSEDDADFYKIILSSISRHHNLSVKELDLLFEAEYFDDIKQVWPIRGVAKKDLAPIVTEYATKHVKELIAESFAFRMVGKKLPKNVEALLDKSLSYAKANSERT